MQYLGKPQEPTEDLEVLHRQQMTMLGSPVTAQDALRNLCIELADLGNEAGLPPKQMERVRTIVEDVMRQIDPEGFQSTIDAIRLEFLRRDLQEYPGNAVVPLIERTLAILEEGCRIESMIDDVWQEVCSCTCEE